MGKTVNYKTLTKQLGSVNEKIKSFDFTVEKHGIGRKSLEYNKKLKSKIISKINRLKNRQSELTLFEN